MAPGRSSAVEEEAFNPEGTEDTEEFSAGVGADIFV